VTSLDNIANGVRVQREITVALKKELIRVTSPDNTANGVKVQKGSYCCAKKKSRLK
jgi:hypothetical protein